MIRPPHGRIATAGLAHLERFTVIPVHGAGLRPARLARSRIPSEGILGLRMAGLHAPSAPLSSTAHGGTLHSCQLSLTVEGLLLAKNVPALLNCGGAAAGVALCIAVQLQRRGSP